MYMEIRKDVFPKFNTIFGSKDEYLKNNVSIVYEVFRSVFSSYDEVVELLNKIRDVKKAELFLDLSRYYNISKRYAGHDFLKVVMIISLIEKMSSLEYEFIDFKDWITKENILEEALGSRTLNAESLRTFIEGMKEEYHKTYGSVRNFYDFLERHLDFNDKIRFITSIHTNRTKYLKNYSENLPGIKHYGKLEEAEREGITQVEEGIMPDCYDWRKCYVKSVSCSFPGDKKWCRLAESDSERKEALKSTVNIFYGMRSKFVHDAKVFPIGRNLLALYDRKPIVVNLAIESLEIMFEKAFKRYFEQQTE